MEFHVSRKCRDEYKFDQHLFSLRGTAIFLNLSAARELTRKLQPKYPELRYQDIFAMGLIDEILHYVLVLYSREIKQPVSELLFRQAVAGHGEKRVKACVKKFATLFPPSPVYQEKVNLEDWLESSHDGVSGWAQEYEEMLMLWVENQNPGYAAASELFDDLALEKGEKYSALIDDMKAVTQSLPPFGPDGQNIIDMLRAPAIAHPDSLESQLDFIRIKWGHLLGDLLNRLLRGIDYLKEVNAFFLKQHQGGIGKETHVLDFGGGGGPAGMEEYEKFSPDRDWMPRVVLLAKTTLVWLDQLTKKHGRPITRLDQIPDEELDIIAERGFNGLWLIGLWERSEASRKIKHRCGNPEAAASAYSLFDYDIADEIGGWAALENLRWRAWNRGIRMASDMVPNHTGIESRWVEQHPDWFIQLSYPPFPSYSFNSENLSNKSGLGIYLEDHYYSKSDAAVVFKRVDFGSGDTRYIYHGNDGTHMPWNDTAQINFLNPEAREAVIQTILHVAKNFPIIRFDAAMTLAKRHIQRLWFPEPGHGGDIASRAEHGMTTTDFNKAIPQEFWREVVDRCAVEAPDTLLLAEAFWMMEGYFVRTLGMHRVYNSAFMNMLKNEENAKYRQTIKNTISFDKDILKRFVNFMNNPDEETAIAQFGNGDKYFGVATLMTTMPGLPMFGHGQVEGYTEKYGMEYRRAYKEESPDQNLVDRHYREVFPIMKKRYLFADVERFYLYDLYRDDGSVNENVFAYSNSFGNEHALVLYNNCYDSTYGTIKMSAGYVQKGGGSDKLMLQCPLADALHLHTAGDRYCIMREQRSNSWIIRRSTDLIQHGLRIVLNGYQSQVFLEIHEVEDNAFGHYRMLHDHLRGTSVPDINEAIRELVLGPVFQAFRETIPESLWAKVPDLFDADGKKAIAVGLEFKAGLRAFINRSLEHAVFKERFGLAHEEFENAIDCLVNLVQTMAASQKNATASQKKAMEYLKAGIDTMEKQLQLIATVLLSSIAMENEYWMLQKKIPGLSGFATLLSLLVTMLDGVRDWKGKEPKAQDLVEALEFMEVQEYLLVNTYDGIKWYNQERFESLCWWAMFWELLHGSKKSAFLEHVELVYGRSAKWKAANDKAAYQLEKLKSELLSPKNATAKSETAIASRKPASAATSEKAKKYPKPAK
jgi:glycosidase